MSTFSKLVTELKSTLNEFDYTTPTEIQAKAIPAIMEEEAENFLISSPTGSGKTEAALFPTISQILNEKTGEEVQGNQILYIAPLRALNRDIFHRMLPLLTKKLGISMSVRNSDTSSTKRRKQAKNPPDILITTPETFQILFCGKLLRKNLKSVKWVIVDEFHSIMDSKRGVQLSVGLERLREITDFSLIGLGAGIRDKEKALNFLSGGRGGTIIEGGQKRTYSIKVTTVKPRIKPDNSPLGMGLEVKMDGIVDKIADIVREERGKVLVFANTRTTVELLGAFMSRDYPEIESAVHHSSLGAEVRRSVEKEFKKGELDCVIATSSLELGIDVGEVDMVVQVLSPRRIEMAIQRVGRSKHKAGKTARGKIIAGTPDTLFESLAIAKLSGKELEPKRIPFKSYDVLAHQIIGLLRGRYIEEEEYPTRDEVFNIVKRAWPYRNLTRKEFRDLLCFMDHRTGLINADGGNLSLSSGAIQYYFKHLSTIPTRVTYDVIDKEENAKIGVLDQKFVVKEVESGDVFLLSGMPRQILEIKPKEGKILTRPSGASAIPPKWEGEMIPVSWNVAEYVGNLRRKASHKMDLNSLPADQEAKEQVHEIVDNHPEGKRFPDPKNLVAEADLSKGMIVLHFPFGTKVNRTVSLLLKHLLTEDRDFPIVATDSDAYRIFLQTFESDFLQEEAIFEGLESAMNRMIDYSLDQQDFKNLLFEAVITSETEELGWHLYQVLRRFGIIGKKARLRKNWMKRLVGSYRDTPPLKEAVREYIFSHMNLERTRDILQEIGDERQLWFTTGISPLGLGAPSNFSTNTKEMQRLINHRYEQMLLSKELKFVCLNCAYAEIRSAKDELEQCPRCDSTIISVVKPHKELEKLVEKANHGELGKREQEKLSLAWQISNHLKSNGQLTTKVIATTGVGLKHALAIMREYSGDKRRLLAELRKREKHYWQYHHIWEED